MLKQTTQASDASEEKAAPPGSMIDTGDSFRAAPFAWTIIAFGLILRLAWYLSDRSLWWDEAALALNVIQRSYMGLLIQPMDYEQAAPIGFLWLSKFLVDWLGQSEYVLRLLPLLASVISLLLFRRLAANWLLPRAALIALAMFAISEPLLRYATEFKQYSLDVLVAIVMLLLASPLLRHTARRRDFYLFGLGGAVAIWFSHASVFVLAGLGLGLAIPGIARRQWKFVADLAVIGGLWFASFAISYLVYVQDIAASQNQLNFWGHRLNMPGSPEGGAFMPLAVSSLADLKALLLWIPDAFFSVMENPGGLPMTEIAGFVFIAGCVALFQWRRQGLLLLFAPLFLALCASGLQKYPFYGRMLLFAAPAILIAVAAGTEYLLGILRGRTRVLSVTLFVLLLAPPFASAGWHLLKPFRTLEIESALQYLAENCQPGDRFYASHAVVPLLRYYSSQLAGPCQEYQVDTGSVWKESGLDDRLALQKDIERMRGYPRVWFLSAYVPSQDQKYLIYFLDRVGRPVDTYGTPGIVLLLYDFSADDPGLLAAPAPDKLNP